MPKKVAVIEEVFAIEGIGTVIALPETEKWSLSPKEKICRREKIQIRKPNGECLETFVLSIEMINRGRIHDGICFSLPSSIVPQDIPGGSELWLMRDGTEPLIEP